jgi:hypothetical protein
VIEITLSYETKCYAWNEAESNIRAAVTREGFSCQDVAISFQYGQIWHSATPYQTRAAHVAAIARHAKAKSLPPSAYQMRAGMGVSIGAPWTDTNKNGPCGTLGGYVELINQAGCSQGVFALTCYHVIYPAIPTNDIQRECSFIFFVTLLIIQVYLT